MLAAIRTAFRQAIVTLVRHPAMAVVAILMLGLGTGVNTTVFSIASAVLMRDPAGVREPGRLMRVYRQEEDGTRGALSYFEYEHVRDRNHVLESLGGYDRGTPVVIGTDPEPQPATAAFVSGSFFATLGVHPAAGRLLNQADDAQNAPPAVVLSHDYWLRAYDARSDVIGGSLRVNGQTHSIVGIASPKFRALGVDEVAPDVWIPFWNRPAVLGRTVSDLIRTQGNLHTFVIGVGRLRPGVSLSDAQANLAALGQEFARLNPGDELIGLTGSSRVELDPDRRSALSTMLRLLALVSALVLGIVCANLANLMLVRATARRHEIGVRLSLGATRADLIRQLMAEAIVISAAGASLGLLVATWTAGLLKQRLPVELDVTTTPDARVFVFAVGVALLCAVAFGLYPAVRAARSNVAGLLQSTRVTEGRSRARSALVVGQIAFCTITLVAAGLFVRTVFQIMSLPMGYQLDRRIGIGINLRPYGYDDAKATLFFQQLQERVGALAGVTAVTVVSDAPLGGSRSSGTVQLEGLDAELQLRDVSVSAGYFETLGMRIERGRDFAASDRDVVVVNRALATRYWPNQDAVGKRLRGGARGRWRTVIGVVNDTRHYSVFEAAVPMVYRPFAESPETRAQLIVLTNAAGSSILPAIRREVHDLDSRIVLENIRTLREAHQRATRRFQTNAILVSVLGTLALLLAAIGLYGTVSISVGERTREIGVRMAVGARAQDIWRLIMQNALWLACMGLAIGAIGALAVTRTIEKLLYGVTAQDPWSYALAFLVLCGPVVVASWLPAYRASRTDPLAALRSG